MKIALSENYSRWKLPYLKRELPCPFENHCKRKSSFRVIHGRNWSFHLYMQQMRWLLPTLSYKKKKEKKKTMKKKTRLSCWNNSPSFCLKIKDQKFSFVICKGNIKNEIVILSNCFLYTQKRKGKNSLKTKMKKKF